MNTARIATAAAALLLAAAPAWAQLYKCTSSNGKVAYQEQPCQAISKEAVVRVYDASSAQAQTSNPIEAGKALCLASVPKQAFKDPESVRVESISGGREEAIEYEGTHLPARIYYLSINAKNSYGGYTGAQVHVCSTNEMGTRVLKFSL
jgi:hypothetical protein